MNKGDQAKNKMDIIDIEKLRAQHKAGLSIRRLSQIHNLPYTSLYRALNGRRKKGE